MNILKSLLDWTKAKDELVAFAEGKQTSLKPALIGAAKVLLIAFVGYYLIKSALGIIPMLIIVGVALALLRGLSR
ncbi:MAG: hypothetical protein JST16_17445 [Bdellovibrionales bacterium]|nr:hypothetical protein [Bdellovibrionales bacterium]